jgi:hypothetical protein
MNKSVSLQQDVAVDEVKPDVKAERAAYVAQLPESKQALHRWMNRLTIASIAVPVGFFVRALVLSIAGRQAGASSTGVSLPPGGSRIAVAWLVFVASATVPLIFVGLHAVLLRAFPPNSALSISRFVTGKDAVWSGVGMMGVLLLVGAFWGAIAYVVWTANLALLEPMLYALGVVIGVGAVFAVLSSLYQQFRRKL